MHVFFRRSCFSFFFGSLVVPLAHWDVLSYSYPVFVSKSVVIYACKSQAVFVNWCEHARWKEENGNFGLLCEYIQMSSYFRNIRKLHSAEAEAQDYQRKTRDLAIHPPLQRSH